MLPKEQWEPGPWHDEPDEENFIDDATGYKCFIWRNRSGSLCGYVGVPESHPLHGKGYDSVAHHMNIRVHGGLTFAGPLKDGSWYFGFDCAHAGDVMPGTIALLKSLDSKSTLECFGDTYKDISFVREEVRRLARQLR